ncbi:FkbM family methyltransferase [Paraconexibacter sp. AEG42_29]
MRTCSPTGLRRLRRGLVLRSVGAVTGRGDVQVLGGLGVNLRLDAAHFPYWETQSFGMLAGVHEPMVQEAMRRTLPAGGTFVDVGCNIGVTALTGARLVGGGGRVIAVDAQLESVMATRANAVANEMGQITAVHAAVSASDGSAAIIVAPESLWTRLASVSEDVHEVRRDVVPAVTLDTLLARHGVHRVDAVKIDVEGAELLVLDGMRETIRCHRPAIICEMHGTNAAFAERMRELDYVVTNLDGPDAIATTTPNAHALAVPRATLR